MAILTAKTVTKRTDRRSSVEPGFEPQWILEGKSLPRSTPE
jgi:hypothetical protein